MLRMDPLYVGIIETSTSLDVVRLAKNCAGNYNSKEVKKIMDTSVTPNAIATNSSRAQEIALTQLTSSVN